MKYLLLTTIAAVLLVGCATSKGGRGQNREEEKYATIGTLDC